MRWFNSYHLRTSRTNFTLLSRPCSALRHCDVVEYSEVADSEHARTCKQNKSRRGRCTLLPLRPDITPLMTLATDLGLFSLMILTVTKCNRQLHLIQTWALGLAIRVFMFEHVAFNLFTSSFVYFNVRRRRLVSWPKGVYGGDSQSLPMCSNPPHPWDIHYQFSIKTLLSISTVMRIPTVSFQEKLRGYSQPFRLGATFIGS